MFRRLALLALSAVFALALSGKALAQNMLVNFDAFAAGTPVEALAIPGVTLGGLPPGPWRVQGNSFATMSGNVIISFGSYAVLTATFDAPRQHYSFAFASNGAATVRVTGFMGATQVFSETFTGSSLPASASPREWPRAATSRSTGSSRRARPGRARRRSPTPRRAP